MEQNILRALHKNFLPKEIQDDLIVYTNWLSDDNTSCEVITDENLQYGASYYDGEEITNAIERLNNSIEVLLNFMLTNNIQVILND